MVADRSTVDIAAGSADVPTATQLEDESDRELEDEQSDRELEDDVDLDEVFEQLKAMRQADPTDAPAWDEEGEPLWGPVVVFESISRGAFREWLRVREGDLRDWCFEPIDEVTDDATSADTRGRVVVYDLATDVHERTPFVVVQTITEQLAHWGGVSMIRQLVVMASPTCKLRDRDQEPDASITPIEVFSVGKSPHLIVEVEYENVSLTMMQQKLLRWMEPETTVQIALGIKIYKSRNHVAVLHLRGREPQVVHFGVGKARNSPPLAIPLQLLYHGATIPEELRDHEHDNLLIDLVALRTTIDKTLHDMEEHQQREEQTRPATKKLCLFTMKVVDKKLDGVEHADIMRAVERDEQGEPWLGEVVVCDSISRAAFREWLRKHNNQLKRWWFEPVGDEDMGRVVVYNRPNPISDAVSEWIFRNTYFQLAIVANDTELLSALKKEYYPVYELDDRDQEADASLTPWNLSTAIKFPTVVVDVAYRNVPLSKLEEKMARWLGPETTIQVAIGIKVNEATSEHIAVVRIRGENADAGHVVHFSGQSKDESVLTFPISALFHGSALPPSLVGHEHDRVRLDLPKLHESITNAVDEHARKVAEKMAPRPASAV